MRVHGRYSPHHRLFCWLALGNWKFPSPVFFFRFFFTGELDIWCLVVDLGFFLVCDNRLAAVVGAGLLDNRLIQYHSGMTHDVDPGSSRHNLVWRRRMAFCELWRWLVGTTAELKIGLPLVMECCGSRILCMCENRGFKARLSLGLWHNVSRVCRAVKVWKGA
jgi:hypothetical protein